MIPTPCVGICSIDSQSELCIGCGRTRQEIATWIKLEVQQQLDLMDEIKTREGPHLRPQRRFS
jgi:predicted Fe-S protein YdhL (DUF1289 family)